MSRRHKLVAGGAALLVAAVAGGAFAATQALTPRQERQAVIDDAAAQLGVEPQALNDALEQALQNRVDAAVRDGRLTEQQGERLKERIEAGDLPMFGLGPRPGFREHRGHGPFHAKLEAAAEYLGMSRQALREALAGGKTLAQVAKDREKSVDGLVDALMARAEQKLEQAVENGRLTEAEKDETLSGLRERLTDLVNGRFPSHAGPRFRRGDRPAFF